MTSDDAPCMTESPTSKQLGSAVDAGLGSPRPQQYSVYGVHVEDLLAWHPMSPMVATPPHFAAWHALHCEALRYEWQQSGHDVHGGEASAHTSVVGILQQLQLSGHVSAPKRVALTGHAGPAARASSATRRSGAAARRSAAAMSFKCARPRGSDGVSWGCSRLDTAQVCTRGSLTNARQSELCVCDDATPPAGGGRRAAPAAATAHAAGCAAAAVSHRRNMHAGPTQGRWRGYRSLGGAV